MHQVRRLCCVFIVHPADANLGNIPWRRGGRFLTPTFFLFNVACLKCFDSLKVRPNLATLAGNSAWEDNVLLATSPLDSVSPCLEGTYVVMLRAPGNVE